MVPRMSDQTPDPLKDQPAPATYLPVTNLDVPPGQTVQVPDGTVVQGAPTDPPPAPQPPPQPDQPPQPPPVNVEVNVDGPATPDNGEVAESATDGPDE